MGGSYMQQTRFLSDTRQDALDTQALIPYLALKNEHLCTHTYINTQVHTHISLNFVPHSFQVVHLRLKIHFLTLVDIIKPSQNIKQPSSYKNIYPYKNLY